VRGEPFYTPARFLVTEQLDFSALPQFLRAARAAGAAPGGWPRPGEFSLDHWLDTIFGV